MLNTLWPILLGISVLFGAVNGRITEVGDAIWQSGKEAFSLAVTLGGAMCLWNGLTAIADAAGVTRTVSRLLRPLLRRLFPRLDPDGEALQAIALNVTANLLGLGNAATPLGLRAMDALRGTMPAPHTASDEMVTFVVMNTASVQLFPATVIALRQAAGSAAPAAVLPAALAASFAVFALTLLASRLFCRKVQVPS